MQTIIQRLRQLVFGTGEEGQRYGAIDAPDKRDYVAEAPKRVELPDRIDLFEKSGLKAENQGNCGSCTAFALTMVKQIMDATEGVLKDPQLEEWNQWQRQEETGGSCSTGDFLQNALKRGMEYWKDEGRMAYEYRVIRDRDPNTLRRWLTMGHPIFTAVYIKKDGSADNFAHAAFKDGIVDLKAGYTVGGHAVPMVGYETNGGVDYFIFQNSWGNWGFWKNGKFLVRADQIHLCQSMYILLDSRDDV